MNLANKNLDPLIEEAAKCIILNNSLRESTLQRHLCIGYNRACRIMEQLEELCIVSTTTPRRLLCMSVDMLPFFFAAAGEKPKPVNNEQGAESAETGNAQEQLDALIGLLPVKSEIEKLTNYIKIQQMREKQGLHSVPMSYHCVFTGNPGTGKTTVARIMAEIYRELGILQKGHLVETDRSGLVAEYVGQTAVKTNNIIDSALDGVLFIDEAYSLVQGGGNDFGNEAIATLIKRMEDDRHRFVVILAGYSDEMKDFINSNSGLQSRFNRYINFPDYDAEELMAIFKTNIQKYDYCLNADAEVKLQCLFNAEIEKKDANFGNGRYVRNIIEKAMENQAHRLVSMQNITSDMLQTIVAEDIPD